MKDLGSSSAIISKGGSPRIIDGIRLDNTVTTSTYDEYRLKAIVSGNLIEMYMFEVPLLLNHSKHKEASIKRKDRADEYRERTAHRGSFLIRRIVHANFRDYDKFISLTFNDDNDFDIADLKVTNKYKSKFFNDLKRYLKKNLKYIVVPEFQKRGAVHYHIVCNLPYVDKEVIEKYWNYGFIDIRAISNLDKQAYYLTKYISKNNKDPRFKGNKTYFTSTNLKRPKPVYGGEAYAVLKRVEENKLTAIRKGKFETKFNGIAKFREYLFDNTNEISAKDEKAMRGLANLIIDQVIADKKANKLKTLVKKTNIPQWKQKEQ